MVVKASPRRVELDELADALRAQRVVGPEALLVDCRERPLGIGQAADTLRLELTWGAADDGPPAIIAKVPALDEDAARTMQSLGGYEREVKFYEQLGPRLKVNLPRYYGSMTADGTRSAVLLEDLSDLRAADQLDDLSMAQLSMAREQLAALQAPFWNSPVMANTAWLHRRLGVKIPGIVERMRTSWQQSRDRLTHDFDPDERAQIDRFVKAAGTWAESLSGHFTLTHHDFRVDNFLFAPDRVVVLDWQTVGWGPPMFDFAYLLGTSVSPVVRRSIERDQVAQHVAALAERGVFWNEEEAWMAYRQASFAVLLMLVPPTGSVKRTDRGDAMFRRLLRSGARMAMDLDADQFLSDSPNRIR